VAQKGAAALDASESRTADAAGKSSTAAPDRVDRLASYRNEVSGFCAAVRVGRPLACGPERAVKSARACIIANEAVEKKARLPL
jgi:hypothetical protein